MMRRGRVGGRPDWMVSPRKRVDTFPAGLLAVEGVIKGLSPISESMGDSDPLVLDGHREDPSRPEDGVMGSVTVCDGTTVSGSLSMEPVVHGSAAK